MINKIMTIYYHLENYFMKIHILKVLYIQLIIRKRSKGYLISYYRIIND